VFDLDKCFTDVNKAGKRDRGRRDKEGWESRDSRDKDREGGEEMEGEETRRDPALPCPSCRRAETGAAPTPSFAQAPPFVVLPGIAGLGGIAARPHGMSPASPGNSSGSRKQPVPSN